MSLRWPQKDPDEIMDYSIDWSRLFDGGQTITSVNWYVYDSDGTKTAFDTPTTTVNGLTNNRVTNTPTVTTIYLENGTNNEEYKLACSVTLSDSGVRERKVFIKVRDYD